MPASARSCGFDFGTSNSSIGTFTGGRAQLIPLQDGRVAIPTAIFFNFEDGEISFGRGAMADYVDREEGRLMRSLKGVLGTALMNDTTQVGTERLPFIDIVALFVDFVREAAGSQESVVMGRPVHFVDNDDEADQEAENQLRMAAQIAGYEHVEFQFEPIAAALDYEQTVTREQLAFVVDIGGGTSDFSIVRVSPDRRTKADRKSDILAFSGVRIGGTDFDRLLNLRTIMPHLGMGSKMKASAIEPPVWWFHDLATWQRINLMYEQAVAIDIRRMRRDAREPDKFDRLLSVIEEREGHALLSAVEQAKIALSETDATRLDVHAFAGLEDEQVTRAQLEAAIGSIVARVTGRLRQTLDDAGVGPEAIDAVFLTGGSSRLPLLRAEVQAVFPDASFVEGDAFGSVATGLTLDAHNRFGSA
jgi:hypothetical chaperone protein